MVNLETVIALNGDMGLGLMTKLHYEILPLSLFFNLSKNLGITEKL